MGHWLLFGGMTLSSSAPALHSTAQPACLLVLRGCSHSVRQAHYPFIYLFFYAEGRPNIKSSLLNRKVLHTGNSVFCGFLYISAGSLLANLPLAQLRLVGWLMKKVWGVKSKANQQHSMCCHAHCICPWYLVYTMCMGGANLSSLFWDKLSIPHREVKAIEYGKTLLFSGTY